MILTFLQDALYLTVSEFFAAAVLFKVCVLLLCTVRMSWPPGYRCWRGCHYYHHCYNGSLCLLLIQSEAPVQKDGGFPAEDRTTRLHQGNQKLSFCFHPVVLHRPVGTRWWFGPSDQPVFCGTSWLQLGYWASSEPSQFGSVNSYRRLSGS